VRRELCIADALAKGPWTPLVRRPAVVAIVVVVMAPPAPTIVVVVRTVVMVVVDALGPSSGLYGVPHVAVGPVAAPDHRCCGSASLLALLMLGRRRIQAVRGRCSFPPVLRALARGRSLHLLRRRCLEQRLKLLAYSSLLGGSRLRAAVQQHGRNGKVLGCPPEERRSVSVGIGVDVRALVGASVVVACQPTCRWRWCTAVRLVGSRTALALVPVPLTGLLLHGDVSCRPSIAGLGIHAHILVKKGQLLFEMAPCLR
jgi:hypothetical protein